MDAVSQWPVLVCQWHVQFSAALFDYIWIFPFPLNFEKKYRMWIQIRMNPCANCKQPKWPNTTSWKLSRKFEFPFAIRNHWKKSSATCLALSLDFRSFLNDGSGDYCVRTFKKRSFFVSCAIFHNYQFLGSNLTPTWYWKLHRIALYCSNFQSRFGKERKRGRETHTLR